MSGAPDVVDNNDKEERGGQRPPPFEEKIEAFAFRGGFRASSAANHVDRHQQQAVQLHNSSRGI